MAELLFNISKVEVSDNGTDWQDLGATKGGGEFAQSPEIVEIRDDQHGDPIALITKAAGRTLKINLLNASYDNLALAFGGNVVIDETTQEPLKVELPNLPGGVEKQVRITTQPVNGVFFQILIKRAKITGNSTISLSDGDATAIPLDIKVLATTDGSAPVEITKVSS